MARTKHELMQAFRVAYAAAMAGVDMDDQAAVIEAMDRYVRDNPELVAEMRETLGDDLAALQSRLADDDSLKRLREKLDDDPRG